VAGGIAGDQAGGAVGIAGGAVGIAGRVVVNQGGNLKCL